MNFFETTSETESTTDGIFSYTVTQSALFYAAWAVSETQHNSKNKTRKLRFQNPSEDNFIVRFEY